MNSCSANSLPLSKVKVLHWALWGRSSSITAAVTNLLWRLQNDLAPVSRSSIQKKEESDTASFTEITLDVRPEDARPPLGSLFGGKP